MMMNFTLYLPSCPFLGFFIAVPALTLINKMVLLSENTVILLKPVWLF